MTDEEHNSYDDDDDGIRGGPWCHDFEAHKPLHEFCAATAEKMMKTDALTIIQITTEVASEADMPIAVIFFDGHAWTLKTVQPPLPEMMTDLKTGLQVLAEQFVKEGF